MTDPLIDDEVVRRLAAGEYVQANQHEVCAAVLALVEAGRTTRQIAEQFRVAAKTVRKWRTMLGVPAPAGAPIGNTYARGRA